MRNRIITLQREFFSPVKFQIGRSILGIFFVSLLVLSGACSGTRVNFSPLNQMGASGKPKPVDAVEIYITKRPDRPYRELGILSYTSWGGDDRVHAISLMRKKAAQLGADGIIMMETGDSRTYKNLTTGQINTSITYQSVAIVFE